MFVIIIHSIIVKKYLNFLNLSIEKKGLRSSNDPL